MTNTERQCLAALQSVVSICVEAPGGVVLEACYLLLHGFCINSLSWWELGAQVLNIWCICLVLCIYVNQRKISEGCTQQQRCFSIFLLSDLFSGLSMDFT